MFKKKEDIRRLKCWVRVTCDVRSCLQKPTERKVWEKNMDCPHSVHTSQFIPTAFLPFTEIWCGKTTDQASLNQDTVTSNCIRKSTAQGSMSGATRRRLYPGKDLWRAKYSSLFTHTQCRDLLHHSLKDIFFSLRQGSFSFYLLFKTLEHKGFASSSVLLKWNLEVGIKKKTKHLALNSLSNLKCERHQAEYTVLL